MSLTRTRSRAKPTYIAIQIPQEGKIWVEAGHFNSFHDAFESFERNDTNTIVFSISEFVKLVGKILTALGDLAK